MEAPDSICLFRNPIGVILDSWYDLDSNAPFEKFEYVRKEVFIEKAENFIYSALNDGIMGTANIEDFMRLFKSIWRNKL